MEILKFIESLEDKSPKNIRKEIFKQGIMSSYNDEDGRMVFYTNKNDRFSNSPIRSVKLWLECNGTIIDTKALKPLVVSQMSHRTNINPEIVSNYINKGVYDIYLTEDGTVVNLYFWKDSWHISTVRGYDMNDTLWGDMTYKTMLDEVAPEGFYERLDKSRCYTLGFKHSNMHKFATSHEEKSLNTAVEELSLGTAETKDPDLIESPKGKLWFIQSVDLNNNNVVHVSPFEDIGVSGQERYAPQEPIKSVRELFKKLKGALADYLDNANVLYGFVIKSRNPRQTGIYSNIILESSLMQKIRQLMYHNRYTSEIRDKEYDRGTYIVLSNYLDKNSSDMFISLFPQYQSYYDKLDEITDALVESVKEKEEEKEAHVSVLHADITKAYAIDDSPASNDLIRSFIKHPTYIAIYYKLLKL